MEKTGRRNLNSLNGERAPLVPHSVELEALHDKREVDQQIIRTTRTCQRAALHDAFCKPPIARAFQWFLAEPQFELDVVASRPRLFEIIGIRRNEKVKILGRKD